MLSCRLRNNVKHIEEEMEEFEDESPFGIAPEMKKSGKNDCNKSICEEIGSYMNDIDAFMES